MADETEEHLTHARRPYREDAIVLNLPDGRQLIFDGSDGPPGKWYVRGKGGWPDMDQPVDVYEEFDVERPP